MPVDYYIDTRNHSSYSPVVGRLLKNARLLKFSSSFAVICGAGPHGFLGKMDHRETDLAASANSETGGDVVKILVSCS